MVTVTVWIDAAIRLGLAMRAPGYHVHRTNAPVSLWHRNRLDTGRLPRKKRRGAQPGHCRMTGAGLLGARTMQPASELGS